METIGEHKSRLQELVEILCDPKTSQTDFTEALSEWRELNQLLKESI